MTGFTSSYPVEAYGLPGFPTTPGAHDTVLNGDRDAFVLKFHFD